MIKRPMLAKDYDPELLVLPALASYKLDGYRAFNEDGVLYTRSGKLVPNRYVQALFGRPEFHGFDGELVVGPWNLPSTFNNTSGPVRRFDGEPDVTWHVFDDRRNADFPFVDRKAGLSARLGLLLGSGVPAADRIQILDQHVITSLEDLDWFEEDALLNGFEGVIVRAPGAPYKFGRSTVNEGYLLKVKRFSHDEAVITRLEEQQENLNEAFISELGFTKRSSAAEGRLGAGMVGSFWVESPKWPKEFKISAGSMSHDEKAHAWNNPHLFIGELARFKFFNHGIVDVPRHGIFDGLRGREDT